MADGPEAAPGRRIFVILNPEAGRGRARKLWPRINESLRAAMNPADLQVVETQAPGEAVDLARWAVEKGYDIVAACGGDGTLHEVVNGLARAGAAAGPGALLVLPAGTGNDFSRSLGLPLDPVRVAQAMASHRTVNVDLGRAGNHFFVNVAGVGFDAEVAAEVNRGGKIVGGTLPYIWAVMKKLVTYRNAPLQIHFNQEVRRRRALLVAVGVAAYYGGGLQILPGADLQDGCLDICVGGDLGKLATLGLLPRLFSGSHIRHPLVELDRAVQVRIEGPDHLHVHADGEVIGRLPVEFACIPGGLRLILPASLPLSHQRDVFRHPPGA